MRILATTNNKFPDGIDADRTRSESFDEDIEGQQDAASTASSESGLEVKMQMPNGYLVENYSTKVVSSPSKNEEESTMDMQRLVLLAKYPNATDEEVAEEINRQQQKKQRQQISFNSRNLPGRAPPASTIDHDTFAEQISSARQEDLAAAELTVDDQSIVHSKSFFANLVERVFPSKGPSQEVSVASHSISSEPTRKISNVNENPPDKDQRVQPTRQERFQLQCKWLTETRTGLVVLFLILLFIIVLIVIIATAVVVEKNPNPNNSQNQNSGTMIPRPDLDDLHTSQPTGFRTGGGGGIDPTLQPSVSTQSPTTSLPSQIPSPAPSVSPVPETTSPTTPSPTEYPSIAPTPLPSAPPSSSPSRAPSPIPTISPSASPTSMPSSAPTVTFLETPFRPIGHPLNGTQEDQRFGHSVALSKDGLVMAVGSPDAIVDEKYQGGIVQVYQWSANENDEEGGSWIDRGDPLTGRSPWDQFGGSVGLSEDGTVLVVSEPTFSGEAGDRTGGVRVFVWTPFNQYEPLGQPLEGAALSDHFGVSVSLSKDGRRLAVGAPYHDNGELDVSGQVIVYELDSAEGRWIMLGNPIPGSYHLEWFGWNLDLNDDGSVVAVGAPRNLLFGGYVNCYEFVDGNWKQLGNSMRNFVEPMRFDDNFGHVVKMNSDGNRLAIGSPGKNKDAPDAGMVVVYELDDSGQEWIQLGNVITSAEPRGNDQFGFSLDLKGDILAVGIPGKDRQGQVDFFQYDSTMNTWVLHPDSLQGEDGSNFGYSVRLTDSFLAVGSAVTSGDNTGRVQVFSQS